MNQFIDKSLVQLGIELPTTSVESSLISRCNYAANEPIESLTSDYLRLLITQEIGLKYLIPRALDLLEEDPLHNTGFYRGDLLVSVIQVSSEFWQQNNIENNRLVELKNDIEELQETISNELMPTLAKFEYL